MTAAVGCGVLLALAAAIFVRELKLWRARGELEGPLFVYSRRRFVRRAVGCAALAGVGLMTWLGLEVVDFQGRLGLFQAWWAVVGLLCLGLLVIPVLDFRETYRHVLSDRTSTEEKLRRELERARRERGGK